MEKIDFCLLGKEKLKKESINEGLQSLKSPDLFPKSFISLLIGKPGSGKTTLIEEMLLNPLLLNNQFDYLFIFSPNELKNIACVINENYSNIWDISIVYKLIDKINNEKANAKEIKNINLLIIFDDFISEMKKEAINPLFTKLFYNRRHLLKNGCISFIITAQKFTITPFQIRPCINSLILFRLNNSEYNSIKKDVCSWIETKIFSKSLSNEYDFLLINLTNGKVFLNMQTEISCYIFFLVIPLTIPLIFSY
jgi:hypothetical protein